MVLDILCLVIIIVTAVVITGRGKREKKVNGYQPTMSKNGELKPPSQGSSVRPSKTGS